MSWHIFVLVWGDMFVERFARLAVPFLAMQGNLPSLAENDAVFIHAYSDELSRAHVVAALAPLNDYATIDVRAFNAAVANGLSGPEYKYEIQRACVRDLTERADGGTIILLDSNFVLADGALRLLADRRAAGFTGATVSALRVATAPFFPILENSLADGGAIGPRALLSLASPALHHITRSFFVDADPFTPYPSQISWPIDDFGFVNRNFLPHPLMIPVSKKAAQYQSTMDYDLVLRVCDDDKIYVCQDSDDILAIKFSDEAHQASRSGSNSPSAADIGLFLLACTNRRHRLFANAAVSFHVHDKDDRFAREELRSQALVDAAYEWVARTTAHPAKLDVRLLMYLKSHLGPIEDFMSPQLEPTAMMRLR